MGELLGEVGFAKGGSLCMGCGVGRGPSGAAAAGGARSRASRAEGARFVGCGRR